MFWSRTTRNSMYLKQQINKNFELIPLIVFVTGGVTMGFTFFGKKIFFDPSWKFDKSKRKNWTYV